MEPLWTPRDPQSTAMDRFRRSVNDRHSLSLETYEQLHGWSLGISNFWQDVFDFTGLICSVPATKVYEEDVAMQDIPAWFVGMKLNWAENMLRHCVTLGDRVAVHELTEAAEPADHLGKLKLKYASKTYRQLYSDVAQLALALRARNIQAGEAVCYCGPNCYTTLVAVLATAAIGAVWSSVASDFGVDAVYSRLVQVKPKVLFSVDAVRYNGKSHSQADKLARVIERLREDDACPAHLIIHDYLPDGEKINFGAHFQSDVQQYRYADFVAGHGSAKTIEFYQADFDHPLWILFSSGTTGLPKAIVHRAGGMLVQSARELLIQGDMKPDDVFFYYSTPAWMMINYLWGGLLAGATLVLFDGSPLYHTQLLWQMAEELKVTIFGTSAKYLDVVSKTYTPKDHHDLGSIRQLHSTGSPLSAGLFEWSYTAISSDMCLASISGGTDLCGLAVGLNTALPVYAGEIQCRNLGMAVEVWSEGEQAAIGQEGELIFTKPFPSMPLRFQGDLNFERYRAAYFSQYPNVWAHGDYVVLTPSRSGNGGGLIMLGRSDAVLNPGGVRFGSSELYDALQGIVEIVDALAIGQKIDNGMDERVLLFVELRQGTQLTDALQRTVKTQIRQKRSPRHVPALLIQVEPDMIPYTTNSKKSEIPVKKIINGAPLSSINASTLRNPACLAYYKQVREDLVGCH
ncbi:uncharacterized protein L969DRAFT_78746 [Mixia osmundae IAM 14324]|uniref:AMP-dependent synthetase/ligase domain-containing protein n=1 Tax=Mixia osmundae (strain CBS 9802 / IAM 14324 / JCM 22182 / KY 12970) TaxID=764103 RepID=G7EAY9_MIXOS|nr:uncharacterized protein L969DRAFT_78746 [Mixia osmundae IAM 14324]KEI37035.1 hypothetical protein L969DRAFT_78746 [Mixia osmundae IAM 14324]GAA99999.1 hypothetical protein E5Q_06702 [Mixia osmundae IAM 14324]